MRSYTAADNSQTIRQCTTKIDALFNEILPVVMHDDRTDKKYNRPSGGWGGGSTPGNSSGGVLLGSPNPDPISDQKMSFFTPIFRPDILSPYPFSVLAFRQKLCHNLLLHNYIRVQTKNLELQMHFEFTYFYFFLIHLELK